MSGEAKMRARIMDSDMRLTQKTSNFNDTLGRARMKGYFTAAYNDEKTAQMLLQAQQEFFGRTLTSNSPETAPTPGATLPAEKLP